MSKWFEFDIHGLASMRVAREVPTARLLAEMFAPFVIQGMERDAWDLTVTGDIDPLDGAAYGSAAYRYTDTMVYLNDMAVQVVRKDDQFQLHGRREMLTMALPLLDRILVRHGAATIHAATVDYQGHGVCLPAWGETGKTSTIAKLMRVEGVSFMGDDWAFLSQDRTLLGYAKPMFIKSHHRDIYPHLFAHKRKPLVPTMLTGPMERLSTTVHPVVTRYPRLASFSRNWSPEHMKVTPRQAFPDATFSERAPLAVTIVLERYDGDGPELEMRDVDWVVSRLVGNFHFEIGRHSQDIITALAATGIVPIEQALGEKTAVLRAALDGTPMFLMRIPKRLSPDQASDMMVEQIREALTRAGIVLA